MVFKLFTHWGFRFGFSLVYLTAPLFIMWRFPMGPYFYKLRERQIAREKSYDQVRMKNADDVMIMTEQAQASFNAMEEFG